MNSAPKKPSDEFGYAPLGLGLALAFGGVTLLTVVSNDYVRSLGIFLLVLGVILPSYIWWRWSAAAREARSIQLVQDIGDKLRASTSEIISDFRTGVERLDEVAKDLGVMNDARFVADGFLGLQRANLALDEDTRIGPRYVRMSMLGHLPSHIRRNRLTLERGRQLYKNWQPPHLINEYVELVNRRNAALVRFLNDGGVVQEIYDAVKIGQYVAAGSTFHDQVVDPPEEILERLTALRDLLDHENYYVCLLGEENDRPGPYFLLKQQVGVVVDLRTKVTNSHFTNSLDGLSTTSPSALKGFEEKFDLTWRQDEEKVEKAYVRRVIDQLILRTTQSAAEKA